jgi:hypothetical protein
MTEIDLSIPDIFDITSDNTNVNPEVSSELLITVEQQLKEKFKSLFGSSVNIADAVSLYQNSFTSLGNMHDATHTKSGEISKAPTIHGHKFEVTETYSNTRDSILEQKEYQAKTTDELWKEKHNKIELSVNEKEYAIYNHTQVDVVIFDANKNVIDTQQLKNLTSLEKDKFGKNRGIVVQNLLKNKYLTDESSPTHLVVPSDQHDLVETALNEIANGTDPEKSQKAKIALQKLQKGKNSSTDADSGSYSILTQTGKDVSVRIASNTASSLLAIGSQVIIGGTICELRDAVSNPQHTNLTTRIKRVLTTTIDALREKGIYSAGKDIVHEIVQIVLGIIASSFKSVTFFLKQLGNAISKIWDHVFSYITGKISSFSDFIRIVVKTIADIGIAFLALKFDTALNTFGIPSVVSGIISASLAGLAIFAVNKGIDSFFYALTSAFSKAKIAEIRREQIEKFCEEAIPQLEASREKYISFVQTYFKERNTILTSNFDNLKNAVSTNNAMAIYSSLNNINLLFGKTLGWSTQEEFDRMMLSDAPFVL